MKHSVDEQETILIYDVQEKKWHIDTTYPPHIRKYQEFIGKIERLDEFRLAGWFGDGFSSSFSVRKKKVLTDEEKKVLRERMKRNLGK